jgi:RNA-binding protein Musashi
MIDKDTGRPRGFGFVTFDSEAAVEATLSRPLEILGKPIEVKKAQPRSNMRDEEGSRHRRGWKDTNQGPGDTSQQQQNDQAPVGMAAGISPQMMAQYFQRMQQYFTLMQQQMAMAQTQGMGGPMGMPNINPAMMQQMQQMQQMKQMMGGGQGGSPSPTPQAMQNMMTPAMMQQIQQSMQNQGQGGMGGGSMMGSMGGNYNAARTGPGYNAQEQLAFEQQKYEQQQRRVIGGRSFSPYQQQGGPTSWEGMYDEVPQPNMSSGPQGAGRDGGMGRGTGHHQVKTGPVASVPANAPTGPKNAGRPGANYRGGGRGGHRGYHPYAR